MRGTIAQRFAIKVGNKDPITGCIPWLGGKNSAGYGIIYSALTEGPVLAHRTAWRLAGKHFTPGLELLHSCDNPGCVNIEHLEEGTHKQNMDDATNKGRMGRPRGSKNGVSRKKRN